MYASTHHHGRSDALQRILGASSFCLRFVLSDPAYHGSRILQRLFDLVGQGKSIVLKRDPAVALFVGNQIRRAAAVLTDPLTGLESTLRAVDLSSDGFIALAAGFYTR